MDFVAEGRKRNSIKREVATAIAYILQLLQPNLPASVYPPEFPHLRPLPPVGSVMSQSLLTARTLPLLLVILTYSTVFLTKYHPVLTPGPLHHPITPRALTRHRQIPRADIYLMLATCTSSSRHGDEPVCTPRTTSHFVVAETEMMANFLELDFALRQRIYCAAGLVTNRDIYLSSSARAERRASQHQSPDLQPVLNMMLVCPAIYSDVFPLLYSTNRLIVRHKKAGDLYSLCSLSHSALNRITNLTIHLNVVSCGRHHHCYRSSTFDVDPPGYYDTPLDSLSSRGRVVLSEWRSVVEYMRLHITPKELELFLVCDTADRRTADSILESLYRLPTLAACHLRLARTPSPELQQLARNHALRATGQPPPAHIAGFPFADLPKELRLRILEYTDLVTPLNEVEWSPTDGYYLHDRLRYCTGHVSPYPSWESCTPERHHGCQFRRCYARSKRDDCFCSRYHTAYSTSPSWCNCWVPPQPIFLVSQAFYDEAQKVFFGRNRIIIMPPWRPIRPDRPKS